MVTFADVLFAKARERGWDVGSPRDPEPFARLAYEDERALKQDALSAFWKAERLPGTPAAVVPALEPRAYRTTSKRKAYIDRRGLSLSFPGAALKGSFFGESALDRPEHRAVYVALLAALARPSAKALAAALNYVVVRGTGEALSLILNVRAFDARVVRGAKQIADAALPGVRSAFLYLDPSESDYYLEARRPAGALSWKRLFGPEWLEVVVDGVKLRFPPTVFSQVSGAMLPVMVQSASDLLSSLEGHALFDLYCGYGLFSLTLGRQAAEVVGVDHDGPAIEAAKQNAPHVKGLPPTRFVAGRVSADLLGARLRGRTDRPEVALLDPPRQGTDTGVVEALGARRPVRVLHICCGTDEIPRELLAWQRAGYELQRARPLDLFAGTANLETMLLLTPVR
jgi:tRNA/tmRNA/rRNA uracil-C5-methylase (TrmA/RlmC/RlmD family)